MKHIHRYQRANIAKAQGKKYEVYRCSLPDCNHYLVPELVAGKKSICWRCGDPFVITTNLLRLAKPHCKNCTKPELSNRVVKISGDVNSNSKPTEELIDIDDFLDDLIEINSLQYPYK